MGLSAEGGYGVAAGVGGDDFGEVGEERLFAEPAGGRRGQESLDASFAAVGLGAERELAVDDGAAEAAFGVVVGRFDAFGVAEGREGGPAFEEVARELPVVLGLGALAGGVLELDAELGLEWRDPGLKRDPVVFLLELLPGFEQV